jgi:hypothetical protein
MMAPTPAATWMQREPTAISLVAIAMPSIPVRSQRPIRENVVNSIPVNGRSPLGDDSVGDDASATPAA